MDAAVSEIALAPPETSVGIALWTPLYCVSPPATLMILSESSCLGWPEQSPWSKTRASPRRLSLFRSGSCQDVPVECSSRGKRAVRGYPVAKNSDTD